MTMTDNKRLRAQIMTSAATGLALIFTANAQAAQPQQEETEVEEIVVSGFRASLENAIMKKRNSSSITESITAEDIGKLPDTSIAESLARLPGVAAQRLDGRANVISIRGLSPDFTTATLNGREVVSTGNNRGVEFDQYPSELLNGVTIYKTPDASLTSQAIGGTIDMQTIRPLSQKERIISVGVRGEYNDLGGLNPDISEYGYRANIAYVDKFADDTIGIALGYARLYSPTQEERYQAWGLSGVGTKADGSNFVDASGNEVDPGTLALGGLKPYVKSNKLKRDSFMGVLEYEPDDSFNTSIDVFYSEFEDDQRLRGIEMPFFWHNSVLQDGMTVEDGIATQGAFDVQGILRNDFQIIEADNTSIGWNTEYHVNETLSLELDLSYSKVDRETTSIESYAGTGRARSGQFDRVGYTFGDSGADLTHQLDYSDPSLFFLANPQTWGDPLGTGLGDNQDGFNNNPKVEDELKAMRFTAEQQFDGAISSIEMGVRFSEREKQLINDGFYLSSSAYPDAVSIPDEYLLGTVDLGFIGLGDMIAYDSFKLYNDGFYISTNENTTALGRTTESFYVKEEVFQAYAQANIDTELGGVPLTGNIGLQAVHTKQSAKGKAARLDAGVLTTFDREGSDKYWEFLPSANFNFEVAENQKIRLGVARTLARARMDDLNVSFSFDFDDSRVDSTNLSQSPWSGKGGNVNLKPWLAWQYDLSYEIYFGKGGYVALAGFYKDLENYIFDASLVGDFTGIVPPSGAVPTLNQGLVTVPSNGNGGKIYGAEFTASLPLDMITPALEGFGIIFNASITDSKVKEFADSEATDLPGLSKKVVNTTVYYENHGFQARVSSRYRSKFLGEVSGLSLARDMDWVGAENIIDAQISYDFTEVGFDNLSVQFQVTNLTNEEFSTTRDGGGVSFFRDYQKYGRNFMLGMSYKF